MRLLSNGTQEEATELVPGEDGLIVARWTSPCEEFSLDLPNACLDATQIVKAAAETETTDATEEDVTWRRKTLRVRKNGKVGTRTHKRKKLYGPVQRYADPRRQW